MRDLTLAAGRKSAVIARLRSVYVNSERDVDFTDHLDRSLMRAENGELLPQPVLYARGTETHGLMVIDGPGGGKSTIIASILARHPAMMAQPDHGPRYLRITVPSPATIKSVALEILQISGYKEVSDRRQGWVLWDLVRHRLALLGIVVLWIDEAHDLFGEDRGAILRILKSLMQGDHPVIIVVSGTERLDEIIRSDPQVHRRFSTIAFPRVSAATHHADFSQAITTYCEIAGIAPPDDPEIVPRLVRASRSLFGRCIENIVDAVERALHAGADTLDVQHFAEIYTMKEGRRGPNIFLAQDWSSIDPDQRGDGPLPPRERRRRR